METLPRRPLDIPLRATKPQDPNIPSLATLNQDVIAIVVHHVHDIDRENLSSLAWRAQHSTTRPATSSTVSCPSTR
jgi:hypothetical protein